MTVEENAGDGEGLPGESVAAGRVPEGLRVIGRLVGLLLLVVGLAMAVCLLGSLVYSELDAIRALALAVACTAGSGEYYVSAFSKLTLS